MPRRRKTPNQRVSEGCGQGTGIDYQPAIWITDFSSTGNSTQSMGWKTRRLHHCLSELEFSYFYTLEWSSIVVDVREQFPLDMEETHKIASEWGFQHPTNPHTKDPNLMTTDFLITIKGKMGVINQARTVKPASELKNQRVREKLDIERFYWESRQISWGIVTENEIPQTLAQNVRWLYKCYYSKDLTPLTERDIYQVSTLLFKGIVEQERPLRDIAADCDDRLGLAPGDSLMVARHLIANRKLLIDLNYPLLEQFRKSLRLLATPSLKADEFMRNVG